MKFEDFIKSIEDAGWQATCDAQHSNIENIWRTMFPVVAALQDEVDELESELINIGNH
jgi:hypothetical protein